MFPKFMTQNPRPSAATADRSGAVSADIQPHIPAEHAIGEAVRDLGGYHEDLRNRCENAVTALTALKTTSDEIETIFVEFGRISKELHATKKELGESERLLGQERASAEDLRGKLATTQSALLRLEAQLDDLVSRHDLLTQSQGELQALYAVSQGQLREREARIKIVEPEFAAAKETISDLTSRLASQMAALALSDETLHDTREELKLLQANLEFEGREKQKFVKLHEDVVSGLGVKQKTIDALSEELRAARDLVAQYEVRQAAFVTEREALTVSLESAKAMHEADSKNFAVKIEAVSARARLAEHLLEKTRGEQRDIFREQTTQTESLRQIRRLETSVESLKQDLQDAGRRCRDLESNEQVLKDRVESLEGQLRDKQRSAEKSAEKIQNLQDLLQGAQERHGAQIGLIDIQLKKFAEEVERERADRVYLEGALTTARRERAAMQAMLIKLKASGQGDPSQVLSELANGLEDIAEFDNEAPDHRHTVREIRPNLTR